jgi:hypothetical protein
MFFVRLSLHVLEDRPSRLYLPIYKHSLSYCVCMQRVVCEAIVDSRLGSVDVVH